MHSDSGEPETMAAFLAGLRRREQVAPAGFDSGKAAARLAPGQVPSPGCPFAPGTPPYGAQPPRPPPHGPNAARRNVSRNGSIRTVPNSVYGLSVGPPTSPPSRTRKRSMFA